MRDVTPPATRTRKAPSVDAACAGAVELARDAAEEVAWRPGQVGDHLGAEADGDRVVTHRFACLDPAYVGWHWAVTVARAPRAKNVTVDEAVLLPGAEALLPPEWVPWSERLRPGDVGVGDLLPTPADDPRLEPGFQASAAAEAVDGELDPGEDVAVAWELGLGRARVLSPLGRIEAAERWYEGDRGPDAPVAREAPAPCSSCGFFLPVAGSFRRLFGLCANEYSPDDGRVVSVDHGCGAHSEIVVAPAAQQVAPPILDDLELDVEVREPADQQHEQPADVQTEQSSDEVSEQPGEDSGSR
ncbi:MAG: DUF3027 domain-containing protein [Motilibacteraceae bacterium]